MQPLSELLEPFKNDGDPTRLICLVDDQVARRVAALWPCAPGLGWRRPKGTQPKEPTALLYWLWGGCVFDGERFAAMAGLSVDQVTQSVELLAGSRLIFPDGTIAAHARGLLQGMVSRALSGGRPKRRK